MRTAPRASRRSPSTLEGDRGQRDAAARAQQRAARHARAYTCGLSSEPVACRGPWRQSLTQSSVSINTGGRRAAVSPGGESGADRTDGMAARVRAPALLCWTRDSSSRTRTIHATDSGDRHTCTLAHTHTERRGQTSTCESAHVREHDGQRQGLPALMYGVTARWSA